MILIRIYYHLFLGLCNMFLKLNNRYSVSFISLINPHSYRLKSDSNNDKLIVLRYFKKAILTWIQSKQEAVTIENLRFQNIGLLCIDVSTKDFTLSYMNHITQNQIGVILTKDKLFVRKKLMDKFIGLFFQSILFLFLFPISLVNKKRRGSLALIQVNIVEWYSSVKLLIKHKVDYLYYFGGYENESNMHSVILKHFGIKTHKICSPNPLWAYKYLVSDAFSLTAPYQEKQVNVLQKNWFVSKIYLWPNYKSEELIVKIRTKNENKAKNILGFISSGIWLRIKENYPNPGTGAFETEYPLLQLIKKYMDLRKIPQIVIILHGIEKRSVEKYSEAIAFYNSIFGKNKIIIYPINKDSIDIYEDVDLCISGHSSANIERLFMKYKTLYAPILFKKEMFYNDELSNITIYREEDLFQKMDLSVKQSADEFFKNNSIEKYLYQYYYDNNFIPKFNKTVHKIK